MRRDLVRRSFVCLHTGLETGSWSLADLYRIPVGARGLPYSSDTSDTSDTRVRARRDRRGWAKQAGTLRIMDEAHLPKTPCFAEGTMLHSEMRVGRCSVFFLSRVKLHHVA